MFSSAKLVQKLVFEARFRIQVMENWHYPVVIHLPTFLQTFCSS
jgi:hypothetical protein